MPVSRIDQVLWLAGFAGHLSVLGILLTKHRFKQFPIFTGFVLINLLRTMVLFAVSHHGSARGYFLSYWTLAFVDVLMQCGLAYEIAYQVFRPVGRWAPDVRRGWLRLISGATIAAAAIALIAPIPPESWEETLTDRGNLFATVLAAQVFVGMMLLSAIAGLPFKTHAGKIAKGFGAYAICDLVLEALNFVHGGSYGTQTDLVLYRLRGSLYIACIAYWAMALWQNASEPKSTKEQVTSVLRDVGSLFSPSTSKER